MPSKCLEMAKRGHNRPKKNTPKLPKLGSNQLKFAGNWSKLTKIGENWSKLVQNESKYAKFAQNWSKLINRRRPQALLGGLRPPESLWLLVPIVRYFIWHLYIIIYMAPLYYYIYGTFILYIQYIYIQYTFYILYMAAVGFRWGSNGY